MQSFKKCLAITVSPTPKYIDRLKQFDLCTPLIYKILRPFTDYYGRPELTLSGLIHYHIILTLTNTQEQKQWMTRSINSLRALGNTKIKLITEGTEDNWVDYIDKEKDIYNEIFINRVCEITPATAPKYKELKKLISQGVCLDLDHDLIKPINQIIKKYNKPQVINKSYTTVNNHIKKHSLKLKLTEDDDEERFDVLL